MVFFYHTDSGFLYILILFYSNSYFQHCVEILKQNSKTSNNHLALENGCCIKI